LADASLVTLTETLQANQVFTIDRRHFETYRIRHGYRQRRFELLS
jgi:predicted nucleic acid-binding protein